MFTFRMDVRHFLNAVLSGVISHFKSFLIIAACAFLGYGIAIAQNPLQKPGILSEPHAKKYVGFLSRGILPAPKSNEAVGTLKGKLKITDKGAATYSVPIDAPPGTDGLKPELMISYNSEHFNGPLGMGFALAGLTAITRVPQNIAQNGKIHGVNFTNDDRFALDGEQLVAINGEYGAENTEYRTYESSFTKIQSVGTQGTGPAEFKVWTKGGDIAYYGASTDSEILAQGSQTVAEWAINRIEDRNGNYIVIQYEPDNDHGVNYPKEIDYTGNTKNNMAPYNKIKFYYEARPDAIARYRAGSKIQITKRLHEIKVYAEDQLVYDYHLTYEQSPNTGRSRLVSVQKCAADGVCFLPTKFNWQTNEAGWVEAPQFAPKMPIVTTDHKDNGVQFIDLNGNGRTDMLYSMQGQEHKAWLNDESGWIENEHYKLTPSLKYSDHSDPGTRFIDLNGNGLADVVESSNEGCDAWMNTGQGWLENTNFKPPKTITERGYPLSPNLPSRPDGAYLLDLNGNGRADMVRFKYSMEWDKRKEDWIENDAWENTGTGWQENTALRSPWYFDIWWRTELAYFWMANTGMQFVDLNGNGLPDIARNCANLNASWINTGNGWQQSSYNLPQDVCTCQGSGYHFLDLNNDGMQDVMGPHYGTTKTYINTGSAWVVDSDLGPPADILTADYKDNGARFVDVNGNGLQDIVQYASYQSGDPAISTWINTGMSWQKAPGYNLPVSITVNTGEDNGVRFVDLNGNGLEDIVFNNGVDPANAWLNKAKKLPDYLVSITDGLGAQTNITYEPLTNPTVYTKEHDAAYPNMDMQGPLYVVSQTSSNVENGSNDEHITNYHYTGAKINHLGWGFLGFHKVTKTDATLGISEVVTYSQDTDHFIMEKILSDNIYSQKGILLNSTENHWAVKKYGDGTVNHTYYFPYTDCVTKKHYDLKGNLLNTQMLTTQVDDYGNPTDVQDKIQDQSATYTTFITDTQNNYTDHPDTWVLGQLDHATVTYTATGRDPITRNSGFFYDDQGMLKSTVTQPEEANYSVTTTYERDPYGNIIQTTLSGQGVESRTTSVAYDPKGRFVLSKTNALDQTTQFEYDPKFGEVTKITDPNGLITQNSYDGFGRLIETTNPDTTKTIQSYAWCTGSVGYGIHYAALHPVYSETTQKTSHDKKTVYATKTSFFDKLDRPIAENTPGFDGTLVWKTKTYDDLDRVLQESLPYYQGKTPLYTEFKYDDLGRVIQITSPDGKISTIDYNGYATTRTNVLDQQSIQITNARDKVVESIDAKGKSTLYKYDAADDLIQVVDARKNSTQITYDTLGRKKSLSDPDKGAWTYDYNVFGELTTQIDAMGHKTTVTYDKLGNMISRTDPAGTSTWTYGDDPKEHNVGLVIKISGVSGQNDQNPTGAEILHAEKEGLSVYTRTIHYDPYSRPDTDTITINGSASHVSTLSYDAAGRIDIRSYPGSVAAQNHYNSYGYLSSIGAPSSATTYWQINTMDAEGHITSETHSNGLITQRTYNAATGFLTDIQTTPGPKLQLQKQILPITPLPKATHKHFNEQPNNPVQKVHYDYDFLGNLKGRENFITGTTESFQYDELNRLKEAKTAGGAAVTYQYDDIGNLAYKSDLGVYVYSQKNAGPHAVTGISGSVSAAFAYDKNGNQIKNIIGPNVKNMIYTSFDKPLLILSGDDKNVVQFYYNADRKRFVREEKSGAIKTFTYYLGNYQLVIHDNTATGAILTEHKYILAPDTLFIKSIDATKEPKNQTITKTYTLLSDHLGSTTVITDENGSVLERYHYMPFGKQTLVQGKKPSYPITHQGFTSHEEIESFNLIHMNGRLYDPIIGRFLSADPYIQFPENTQGLNRYSYCLNNPLSFTDTTGYFLDDIIDFVGDVFESIGDILGDILSNEYVAMVAQIAIATVGMIAGGPILAAALTSCYQGVVGLINGGDIGAIMQGVVINMACAVAWGGVGATFSSTNPAGILAHGVVGGGLAELQGGDFQDGFISAATSKAVTYAFPIQGDYLTAETIAGRTFTAAVIGGTSSAITGGDFATGAKTAAYAQLFNCLASKAHELATKAMQNARNTLNNLDVCTDPKTAGSEKCANTLVGAVAPGEEKIADILKPEGKLIGEAGASEAIRILHGGEQAAEDLFSRLAANATLIEDIDYRGMAFRPSEGGFIGYRAVSRSGPPTIDVNVPGLEGIKKIKFLG